MSNDPPLPPAKDEPYQAWAFQDEAYPAEAAPPPGYRPGGLTAICIIALVLGALGVLTGCSGVGMALVGNQVQQWQQKFSTMGSPAPVRDVQTEMNLQSIRIFNRYRVVNLILAVCQLLIVGALIGGAIQTLRSREMGRRLLVFGCLAAIGWEVVRAVPHTLMQLENTAMMEEYMPRMMEAQAPGGQAAQMAEFARMIAHFSTIMGWVIFFGWLMMKLAFYGVAARYLTRPKIKSLFGDSSVA